MPNLAHHSAVNRRRAIFLLHKQGWGKPTLAVVFGVKCGEVAETEEGRLTGGRERSGGR